MASPKRTRWVSQAHENSLYMTVINRDPETKKRYDAYMQALREDERERKRRDQVTIPAEWSHG